ncbi:MAG TPA: hypothetical protein VF950_22680 [Planctomycetota bacterium]
MDTSFDETFALAQDKAEALKQLIPGTEDYYYYHCLWHEQARRLEEVGKLLDTWVQRHGWTARAQEIKRRRTLLGLPKNLSDGFETIRQELGLGFGHEQEIEGQTTDYPTKLSASETAREAWMSAAWSYGGATDLQGFSDAALDALAGEKLEPDRRRALLQRLKRPDVPQLAELVLADLKHKHSGGFGSLPIHQTLTRAQLEEMAKKDPALLKVENFVHALIVRRRPGPEDDGNDPELKSAYLDELWDLVKDLVPAFNALKLHVLYHRLDFDRSQGVYERGRFDEYVKIPRHVSYAAPKYIEACSHDPAKRAGIVSLGRGFEAVTGLPTVSSDEALVVDYLSRFFVDAKDYKAYETWIQDGWLKIVFAETKILNGVGDMEKWYSLLNDPGRYQALKDRVEVTFPPHNRALYRASDKVSIDVDVKNVENLVVKVFEINTLNVFLSRGEEVDTSLDLDGLVAAEERAVVYKEAPARRVRRTFDFPSLARPGVYVVEFIGGGISSRALIRKGRLRFVERVGAAGHVFTVLDEDFTPLRDASIWMGGREYAADKEGEIAIPFSERPGRQAILLRHGALTTLEAFDHRAETYDFTAGIYVDREALLRRAEAQVLLRPSLRVHGASISLKLLETPLLSVLSRDRHGVETTMEIRGLELRDDRETVVPFQVPEDVVHLSFQVRARVEALGSGRKVDVADQRDFTLNGIEATEQTQDLHLARAEKGYVINALGKTGEARAAVPVTLSLRHREFSFERSWTLQTDARGRVELGALEGVVQIRASLPSGAEQSWTPPRDLCSRPSTIHARAGEPVRVPFMGDAPSRLSAALLERVNGTYRADWFDVLGVKDGFLTLGPLGPGDYELVLKDEDAAIQLRISDGVRAAGWLAAGTRLLEESGDAALQISKIKAGKDELRVRVENATPTTRVHVFATRYLPVHSAFHELAREGVPEPWATGLAASPSAYVSGRDIGDEYRYILERKRAKRWPGNMLTRPGLLLNPWAVRSTQTGVAAAAAGEAYAGSGAPAPCAPAPRSAPPPPPPPPGATFSSLDFLANPTAVIANLKPDADGAVAIPRKALAHANQVRIVAVDASGVVARDVLLPECSTPHRDLRLLLGLDPAKHYSEKKDVAVVDAGGTLEIADVTTTKLETYDTLGRAFALFKTLSGLATLDAFEFVTRWPSLSDAEKKAKYSEFACHELHFFLSKKDPAFFKTAIQPYLRNKKDKTFMDRCLLGDDLAGYRRPWEFGRLNVVERILLGRRIDEERDPVKRHAADLCDLLSRDLNAENARFDTALKGKALEIGDALGFGAATAAAAKAGSMGPRSVMSMADCAAPAEMAMDRLSEADEEAERSATRMEKKKDEAPKNRARRSQARDLDRRKTAQALYRALDKTQEWAENNYYKLPIDQQGPELVTINRFWRDYARHDGTTPFLSPHLAEASRSLTEILCALAVLDLPFEAKKPATSYDGARMKFTAKSLTAVFHRQIRPAEPSADKVPVLVSQNFLRDDDRERYEGEESFDKYVTEEFLVHTVYVCQVVLTNPTSSTHKLDLLLQIPLGALPAKNGFYTKGIHVELSSYATETHEYAFYFPVAGVYDHYPVHVSRNEKLVASAVPWPLKVVDRLTKVDTTSWEYVSQHADAKTTLKFLKDNNIDRLDLERAAWRMKDKAFYGPALDLLAARHVYHDVLWSYSVRHEDAARARDYLLHQEEWLKGAGARLEAPTLAVDPVERRWYEHLEYAPLVNARSHRLGASRRILNDRFSGQYQRLVSALRYRAELDADDRLAVTYYLFLQDRVEEGLAMFDRVKREDVETRLQYDYLKVYAEFFREKPKAARGVAEKYKDYPVDRWRKLFQNALAQLDEVEGDGAAVTDAEDRDQRQGLLAATAPSFDLAVENRQVTITFQNLTDARVNYYRMDIELLFSRQPFVQEQSDRFGFIMPNRSDEVTLPKKGGTHAFALPAEFNGANVIVEVVADGRRVSKPCFAHELDVALVENYGQLRVSRRDTKKPLAKAYVKAYARSKDGTVAFFKDGYTDPRGRFDYSSLSTDDLDRVDRFALLVMSDEHGATVREAEVPKR